VLHVFIVTPLNPVLREWVNAWTHSKLIAVVVSGLICLTLSVLAAYISYNVYEKRFLQMKRLFAYEAVAPARVSMGAAHGDAIPESESLCSGKTRNTQITLLQERRRNGQESPGGWRGR